jgi:hypothetical protein
MTTSVTRRGALAAFAALAFSPVGLDEAFAAAGLRVSRIHVDVSRVRARRGDPTARWVAEDMPQAVARSLGPRFQRGAPGGAVLNVHVDDVLLPTLRSGRGARIIDEISGFISLSGPGSPPLRRAIRVVSPFRPSARDQPMRVEANRRRVSTLVDRFAQQVPRDLGL